jgi:hypothetical protein
MPRPAEHTGSVPCRATYDTRGRTYSPSSPQCSVRVSRRRINAARERSSDGYAARPTDGAIERKTEIIRRRGPRYGIDDAECGPADRWEDAAFRYAACRSVRRRGRLESVPATVRPTPVRSVRSVRRSSRSAASSVGAIRIWSRRNRARSLTISRLLETWPEGEGAFLRGVMSSLRSVTSSRSRSAWHAHDRSSFGLHDEPYPAREETNDRRWVMKLAPHAGESARISRDSRLRLSLSRCSCQPEAWGSHGRAAGRSTDIPCLCPFAVSRDARQREPLVSSCVLRQRTAYADPPSRSAIGPPAPPRAKRPMGGCGSTTPYADSGA